MNKFIKTLSLLPLVIIVIFIGLMFAKTFIFHAENDLPQNITNIDYVTAQIGNKSFDLSLPNTFNDLDKNEIVTLCFQLDNNNNEVIYFKTIYCPIKVYANDELIYNFGQDGTFPDFMISPAVKLKMINLPEIENLDIKIEYLMSKVRSDIELDTIIVGSEQAVIYHLLINTGFQFVTACFLAMAGIFLIILSLMLSIFRRDSLSPLWLGLSAFLCGCWGFGECDLSGLIVQKESFLYVAVFCGVSLLPVPIFLYLQSVIKYKNPVLSNFLIYTNLTLATISIALQALGLYSFYQTLPIFMFSACIMIISAPLNIYYEWKRHRNISARNFIMPSIILAFSVLVEIFNFIFRFSDNICVFTQIGIFIFILYNGILYARMLRELDILENKNKKVTYEYKLMEQGLREQKRYHNLLLETRENIRVQKHDLRHQLAVIQSFLREGSIEKAKIFLDNLNSQIPSEPKTFCENMAVNAILGYYVNKAHDNGIKTKIELCVNEYYSNISDNDLCVIFGNIFENALEACIRMKNGDTFINLKSLEHNKMLIITQDNSFDGNTKQIGDNYISSKRSEFGVGLNSVQSIAKKHSGDTEYKSENNIFYSSIYLQI